MTEFERLVNACLEKVPTASTGEAMELCARLHPELYAAHRQAKLKEQPSTAQANLEDVAARVSRGESFQAKPAARPAVPAGSTFLSLVSAEQKRTGEEYMVVAGRIADQHPDLYQRYREGKPQETAPAKSGTFGGGRIDPQTMSRRNTSGWSQR